MIDLSPPVVFERRLFAVLQRFSAELDEFEPRYPLSATKGNWYNQVELCLVPAFVHKRDVAVKIRTNHAV